MIRRTLAAVIIVAACAGRAEAQFVVIDRGNLAQAILIAERAWRHYDELKRQYQTILRMGQGLGSMEGYRIPTIRITGHDPARWEYGRSWIQGLNSGDATGAAYLATTLPLMRPAATPPNVTAAARRALERQYATIEITDSVAMMGGHQVALARGYHRQLQQAVQALEGDVMNGLLRYHEMTAILDKIAAWGVAWKTAGHVVQPASLACARTASGPQQTAAGHRGRDDQHAAHDVAGWSRGQRGVRHRHR